MKISFHKSNSGQPRWGWTTTLAAAVLLLVQSAAFASDPIGVFAVVDKVVLEPGESAAPERIQIWGAFALADRKDRDAYKSPEKGFLYFSLPKEKADVARKEWNDLKKVAGKNEVLGFGSRFATEATVRKSDAKPIDPDPYVLGWGIVKMSQRQPDYPPIKALLALKGADKATTK